MKTNIEREQQARAPLAPLQIAASWTVAKRSGAAEPFDRIKLERVVQRIAQQRKIVVDAELIVDEALKNIFNGATTSDVEKGLILAAVAFIERDPNYNILATGIFLQRIYRIVLQHSVSDEVALDQAYRAAFIAGIKYGVEHGVLDKRMLNFPLEELSKHLVPSRDELFRYTGIQTLYDRYFLKDEHHIYETPQAFWMRVAMGLSLVEPNAADVAVKFYDTMSTLRYLPSTPTLLNAGRVRAQMSSCFLTFIDDDLEHIFKCLKDNAHLSKWSGGIGNDWTALRGTGATIKTIGVKSQGLIPFLKIANDVVAAIYRGGSRRAATVSYLENWHIDFEDYLDLRKNTGDERRRAHDMNTASWISDLFMKRVLSEGQWTFFSPDEVPDLHETYGKEFEIRYEYYERMAAEGKIKLHYSMPAIQLWRKMLSRLFETGHPWIVFKDACNVRSPQDHAGIIHSSNLCTEITLNTSREEVAVCNIGSINLERLTTKDGVDHELLEQTVTVAMRMLDNVVDLNFYAIPEAETSNMRHRPVGLGLMGTQDALFKLDMAFEDARTLKFCDELMERISYHAIKASALLAEERGAYPSFKGSKWDRGIFPIDTLDLLEQERGMPINVDRRGALDWTPVRELVARHGMRNSNTMAIAPTATISYISGCFPSFEPIYKNLYVKANMGGEFTIVNEYLVNELKELGLWSQEMLDQIKYYDGSIQMIEAIPDHIKAKHKETFEIDAQVQLALTAARGKWIDQSQSHNVCVRGATGKQLHDIYMYAWQSGMKATYYLRTLGASQIEKSTLDAGKFGFTQRREYSKLDASAGSNVPRDMQAEEQAKIACSIEKMEECEACQ